VAARAIADNGRTDPEGLTMQRDDPARVARWSSHRVFLFAAVGATLGLGNVWRFPRLAADYGGSAFVVAYLLALVLLGLPLLLAELVLARRTAGALPATFPATVRSAQAARGWAWLPWLVLTAAWLVLAGLVVVGGWLLAYLAAALAGDFVGISALGVALRFDALARAPALGLAWLVLFVGSAAAVSAAGVRRGLERAAILGLALIVAAWAVGLVYLLLTDRVGVTVAALLPFDATALGVDGLLAALVQAFFTLTLGVGAMHAYAVHLPPGGSLPGMALRIAGADALLALVAAVLVLGLLAAADLDPAAGPLLLFDALPLAFGRLPGGHWLAVVFYASLALVAWLTTLALFEPLVLALAAGRRGSRPRAAALVGGSLALAGALLLAALAATPGGRWAGYGPLGWFDYVGGHLLVPLSALLLALFVGWLMPERERRDLLLLVPGSHYQAWRALLRYLVPPLLLLVLLSAAGILRGGL
jgi:NSS family neurotransmitter:Na+ symporter